MLVTKADDSSGQHIVIICNDIGSPVVEPLGEGVGGLPDEMSHSHRSGGGAVWKPRAFPPEDSKYIQIEPLHVAMSSTHVVVASEAIPRCLCCELQ